MPLAYNPIVRTFCRVRAVLVSTLGVERRQVAPRRRWPPSSRRSDAGSPGPRAAAAGTPPERVLMDWPLCGLTAAIPFSSSSPV
jgi:hypothetical protein